MAKQFKLNDFEVQPQEKGGRVTPCSENRVTTHVLEMLLAQKPFKEIARELGWSGDARNKQKVYRLARRLKRDGLVKWNAGGFWEAGISGSVAVTLSCAGSPNRNGIPAIAGRGGSVSIEGVNSGSVVWGAHHVRGSALFRREGDWGLVSKLAHRVNRVKPNQFIFYFGDATLTARKRSVQVEVFGLRGQTPEQVFRKATEKAKPLVEEWCRDFGFVVREFEWRKPVHWVLDRELSKDFLRFAPDLADGSHPGRVETRDEKTKAAIDALLSGQLELRLEKELSRLSELELVVRQQAVVIARLVDVIEKQGRRL